MTLRRQLFVVICSIFFIILAGLLLLSISSTKDYLQQQLASHAQDAATSLSYPLAAALAQNDKVLAEVQVASMFDRGYYQKIEVRAADGKVIVDKEMPQQFAGAPQWFVNLLPISVQPGEAFITSGWRQLGKALVLSQPSIAYAHLWHSVLAICGWMLAAFVVALVLTELLLRMILKPLKHIEDATLEISSKRFVQIGVQPKARELNRVVRAMNFMSRRISEAMNAEAARAETYRREAYVDSVTGLDNRRSFDLRFNQLLDATTEFQHGLLITLELDQIKAFNNEFGYGQGNQLLSSVARGAQEVMGDYAAILSRSGGTSFTFLFLDADEDLQIAVTGALQTRVIQSIADNKGADKVSFNVGCTLFRAGETGHHVLARADLAVERARQARRNGLAFVKTDEQEITSAGSHSWRTIIEEALAHNRVGLLLQPVVTLRDGVMVQQEVTSRLIDAQGNPITAAMFMPMALRHQLMPNIDQAVISQALAAMRVGSIAADVSVSLNVTAQSMASGEFRSWLETLLRSIGAEARRLSFEVSEFGYSRDLDACASCAALVRKYGAKFGVDHFGLDPEALKAVRVLTPDFIKLNGNLVREATDSASSREHLRSIIRLAASLDVPVTAQNIESEAVVNMLQVDHVTYGQGYYFGAPTPLP
ncbi:EAL domain-containing protein [Duganella sp. FT94W]|uniref:EAL domain-containing protein n=1 Tax=Duganella lactea TaxID=2692173 RepID=A0ABW9VDA5_9BURK|nr:EAL domain-containing protein [Duganella lactea]MYM37626.1 EAL domain-containing protein [Duganella lactea]